MFVFRKSGFPSKGVHHFSGFLVFDRLRPVTTWELSFQSVFGFAVVSVSLVFRLFQLRNFYLEFLR